METRLNLLCEAGVIPGINAFTRCRSLTSIALSGSRIVTANQTDS